MQPSTALAEPPALIAIIRAARRIGDKQLERAARKELAERYGIEVTIRRPPAAKGGTDAR